MMLETLFVALVVGLVAFYAWVFKSLFPKKHRLVTGALVLWLIVQAVLAHQGFFSVFDTIPPRLALILFPNIVLLIWFGAKKLPLKKVPANILVFFQSFRIVMEIILYSLVSKHLLPEILTFTGSNFDVLVGITAPMVAFFGTKNKTVVKIWNVIGFLILTNTVVHGILAAPTRFQVFHTLPANTLIGLFPWIWLPGFVVPFALLGHVLSFKRTSSK